MMTYFYILLYFDITLKALFTLYLISQLYYLVSIDRKM